jgi:hypothetical protein
MQCNIDRDGCVMGVDVQWMTRDAVFLKWQRVDFSVKIVLNRQPFDFFSWNCRK